MCCCFAELPRHVLTVMAKTKKKTRTMAASGTDADGAAAGSGDQLPLDDLLQLLSLETRVDIRSTALE